MSNPLPSLGRVGSLEVRLAQSAAEVTQAQQLRYRVFFQEGSAIPNPARLLACRDFDAYDIFCDHLLVIDHAAQPAAVVGQLLVGLPPRYTPSAPKGRPVVPPEPAPRAQPGDHPPDTPGGDGR